MPKSIAKLKFNFNLILTFRYIAFLSDVGLILRQFSSKLFVKKRILYKNK